MQKPSDSTLLNICIIPDEQVGRDCVALSQSLESKASAFVLGDGKFAHMTVFMARFSSDKVPRVIKAVEEVLQSSSGFRCEHSGYFMTQGRYLEVSYRKSSEFMTLHEALIEQLAPLRIDPGNPYQEGFLHRIP